MILLLLLVLSVYPSSIDISGLPGEHVELPLLLVGDGEARIEGGGVIEASDDIILEGKTEVVVEGRISQDALPGLHKDYLYIAPYSDALIRPASAVEVNALVSPARGSSMIDRTRRVFSTNYAWLLIAASSIAITALLITTKTIKLSRS